jgi:hypothetical protein
MSAMTVVPMANPISARRTMPLTKKCLTGEARVLQQCGKRTSAKHIQTHFARFHQVLGQCRRKLPAPKVSLTDAAAPGVLSGPVLFAASFTKSPLRNR